MMNDIKLTVDDNNLEILLTILQNLKPGLIKTTEINGRVSKASATQYQPKTNKVIKEQDSGVHDTSGKYINPAAYKQRLKKK